MSYPLIIRGSDGRLIDGWSHCEVAGSAGCWSVYAVVDGARVAVGMPYTVEADALARCRQINLRDQRVTR